MQSVLESSVYQIADDESRVAHRLRSNWAHLENESIREPGVFDLYATGTQFGVVAS
jgi:hypothetical protein